MRHTAHKAFDACAGLKRQGGPGCLHAACLPSHLHSTRLDSTCLSCARLPRLRRLPPSGSSAPCHKRQAKQKLRNPKSLCFRAHWLLLDANCAASFMHKGSMQQASILKRPDGKILKLLTKTSLANGRFSESRRAALRLSEILHRFPLGIRQPSCYFGSPCPLPPEIPQTSHRSTPSCVQRRCARQYSTRIGW